MTAWRLIARKQKHLREENSNPNIGLTAIFAACYSSTRPQFGGLPGRCPSGAVLTSGGSFARLVARYSPLLLQAQSGAAPADSNSSILGAHRPLRPHFKAVLLILALMSVGSWAIVLYKIWVFRRAERQSTSFLDVFRRSSKFSKCKRSAAR